LKRAEENTTGAIISEARCFAGWLNLLMFYSWMVYMLAWFDFFSYAGK
jgi:hypothetical protein